MHADLAEKLDQITALQKGSHGSPDAGMCVLEAAAYVGGQPFSDHPPCVSPVIGAFLRNWNDNLPCDADRTRLLKPLIPVILDTAANSAIEERRSYMALDWMIRTYLPTWLRVAKLDDAAARVEALAPIIDYATAGAAAPLVREAKDKVAAARAAARAAAWAAAVAAAVAAARDALKPTIEVLQQSAVDLVKRMAALSEVV